MPTYTLDFSKNRREVGIFNGFEIPAGGGSSFASTNSFQFDGTDAFLFSQASPFSLLDGQNKATFSMWVKPTLSDNAFILYVPSSPSARAYTIVIYSTGMVRHQIDSSGIYTTTNTGVITANIWQHILVCVDLSLGLSLKGKIFVNGIDVTSGNNLNKTTYTTSAGGLQLSGRNEATPLYYSGLIDEVAIWGGNDLRNEASSIWNNGIPGDLNNSGLSRNPDLWYRMGENATWGGREFNIIDTAGNYNALSSGMIDTDISLDVPS
jgi:hypothetical protein